MKNEAVAEANKALTETSKLRKEFEEKIVEIETELDNKISEAGVTKDELEEAIKNPFVIHYTDEFFNRPWFKNCTHPLRHLYIKYLSLTPWKGCELQHKELTRNCKIQNWVYSNCPFFVYKLMIRFIEFKHRIKK